MNTVTAQDFRDLKEARIKGSLNARIKALEESVSDLEQMVEAICDLLEAYSFVDFSGNIKLAKKDHTDVDEDTPDEYNRMNPENYGGTK
jgi:hypothetical protein